MSQRVPHPHDRHLEQGWKNCRWGIHEVLSDSRNQEQVVRWIDEKLPELKSLFLRTWRLIVTGDECSLVRELQSTERFFDLPEERQDEWGRLVQSHPFATLLARARTRA